MGVRVREAGRAIGRRPVLLAGVAAAAGVLLPSRRVRAAEAPPLLRISTENAAEHIQTRIVARFAERLAERAEGRIAVRHSFGAQSFRDRDVFRAMDQGRLEMAVPGTWQLDRVDPSVGVLGLPAFYGHEASVHNAVRDGPLGREINRRLEVASRGTILGRWIDLGFINLYGVNRVITTHADLKGLRIRVAGGEANLHRLTAMGAQPRVIPWSDLPEALAEGQVDGLCTSHETVVSRQMWGQGVCSGIEDRQYFAQYIPLVAGRFWDALPPPLRDLAVITWEDQVEWARAEAAAAQQAARHRLLANDVVIVAPPQEVLAAERARLMTIQPAVVAAMRIDPELVKTAMAALGQG